MQRYKIKIAYDGTNYHGWQIQLNKNTVQAEIQKALFKLLQKKTFVSGSGRTDAGVHALEQVAHFDAEKIFDEDRFLYSLNCLLPKDIRILSLKAISGNFHARYSATGKIYRYYIHFKKDPFIRQISYFYPYSLNIFQMKKALPFFIGKKNFLSFACSQTKGAAANKPIKTMHNIILAETPNGIYFELHADGFLYKMVRNIVGTLLDIGRGKLSPSETSKIFYCQDRKKAGAAVPPEGLFLIKVFYDLEHKSSLNEPKIFASSTKSCKSGCGNDEMTIGNADV